MFAEILNTLADWAPGNTWTVIIAVLAGMACALPGNFLLLRRQSMMGDALSHTALLGIVLAVVFSHWLWTSWLGARVDGLSYRGFQHVVVFGGAVGIGVATTWLTEWVGRLGRVEASAALGVVFTSLFALALLLIPLLIPRSVHIDVDCVLLGKLEFAYYQKWSIGSLRVPSAAILNGGVLLMNLVLVVLLFKELRISAFDPGLATTQGINAHWMHYALMAATAVTVVAAFESVGSILVIAMLIVPPATAKLLSNRLSTMVVLSLAVAALAGVLGHVMALTLPPMIFHRLAEVVQDEQVRRGLLKVQGANTSGMMAVAVGLLFVIAMLFSPRQGVFSKLLGRVLLSLRIAREDLLGVLYRLEEAGYQGDVREDPRWVQQAHDMGGTLNSLAIFLLKRRRQIVADANGYRLTDAGRQEAERLIRSHRLWEGYMAKHFDLPEDHLHDAAERVEHYVSPELREELTAELDDADVDPHGKSIPPES